MGLCFKNRILKFEVHAVCFAEFFLKFKISPSTFTCKPK